MTEIFLLKDTHLYYIENHIRKNNSTFLYYNLSNDFLFMI